MVYHVIYAGLKITARSTVSDCPKVPIDRHCLTMDNLTSPVILTGTYDKDFPWQKAL